MMLLPIISSWMSIEGHRRLVQVLPDSVRQWWDKWELRGLILISLISQIILTLLGNRRRYKPNILTRPLVWSAYLMADWAATVAMGVISSQLGEFYYNNGDANNFNPQLVAFWAPFFLMHLGGPDTITAYALEDNELWLRNLVGMFTQTALTLYIIIMSWESHDRLSHLSVAVLIIGFVKYAEKTRSLYCGSIENLRNSFLRSIDSRSNSDDWLTETRIFLRFMYIFVSLFVDLVLSPWDLQQDKDEFRAEGAEGWRNAFCVVDDELKSMYDVFHTKAFANYGVLGMISRFITLTSTIVVLVLYNNNKSTENYEHLSHVDRIITYLLLAGAVISEIYAFISIVLSHWTRHYFIIRGLDILCMPHFIKDCFGIDRKALISFGECSFLTSVCDQNRKVSTKVFPEEKKLKKLLKISHCSDDSSDLQCKIFYHLYKKSEGVPSFSGTPGYRQLIINNEFNVPTLASGLEFHQTIIAWHIATDVFYHSDRKRDAEDYAELSRNSKHISDYMFFLLVERRHMLPVGAGLVTIRDTIVQAFEILKDIEDNPQEDDILAEACRILLQHETLDDEMMEVHGRSVLPHACRIAKKLMAHDRRRSMWEFMEELWVELMSYAGAYCRVDSHAQQLRRGPEFLTHVWLLQAHFGLLEQFQGIPHQVCKPRNDVSWAERHSHAIRNWPEAVINSIVAHCLEHICNQIFDSLFGRSTQRNSQGEHAA